ncbi:hypothetical protein LSO9J_30038 [Candidatus Liberibacter solanacearum]
MLIKNIFIHHINIIRSWQYNKKKYKIHEKAFDTNYRKYKIYYIN